MEVVPAINEVDRREVERKVRTAESFAAERVQIDFADKQKALGTGVLAQYVSLVPAEINYEIHIMSEEPEKEFPFWLFPKVERIIFHLENSVNPLDFKKYLDRINQAVETEIGLINTLLTSASA